MSGLLLPLDTGGADRELHRLGFRFERLSAKSPGLRSTSLPSGWAAKGLRPGQPLTLVDHLHRRRVVVRYPQVTAASMRLVGLIEYLDECISLGAPVLSDSWWATPADIALAARGRARRDRGFAAEFTRSHCGRLADHYIARAWRWGVLADRFTASLEAAA